MHTGGRVWSLKRENGGKLLISGQLRYSNENYSCQILCSTDFFSYGYLFQASQFGLKVHERLFNIWQVYFVEQICSFVDENIPTTYFIPVERRLYYETTERNRMPKHVYSNYHWCIWMSRYCTEDYLVHFCKDLQPFEVGMKQVFIMHERQPHTKNHDCKGKLVIKWKWHNYNHA